MAMKLTKPTEAPAVPDALAPTEGPTAIPGLGVRRIVHYVLPGGAAHGECRPAILVCVWDRDVGSVNRQVFTDGANDERVPLGDLWWQTSYSSTTPKRRSRTPDTSRKRSNTPRGMFD